MNQIEKVARAKLIDELALAIDQFLTHRIERDTLACDLTQDELTELATGLSAIAAMPVQAEPVAWRYERTDGFVILVSKRYTDQHPKGDGWTETPLYAHPPAQWQGIESAPRDGTDLIVAYTHIATVCVFNAFYANPSDGWDADDEGWWTYTYSEVSRVKLDGWQTPTHWMPLPTPPAGGSDAE